MMMSVESDMALHIRGRLRILFHISVLTEYLVLLYVNFYNKLEAPYITLFTNSFLLFTVTFLQL